MAKLNLAENVGYGCFGDETEIFEEEHASFEEAKQKGLSFVMERGEGTYTFAPNWGAYQEDPHQQHSDCWFWIE